MSKKKNDFICSHCQYKSFKWIGNCPSCLEWNTFVKEQDFINTQNSSEIKKVTLTKNLQHEIKRISTGFSSLDRVLGGGIVEGSLNLIGGEPGVGKTTLLSLISGYLASQSQKVLYISAEESLEQLTQRFNRLGISSTNLFLIQECSLEKILCEIKSIRPSLIILDSVQTLYSDEIQSFPGSVNQIREVTFQTLNICKSFNISAFLVGHITKDGAIAGPKLLEHMVDSVIYFEGDSNSSHRVVRCHKNRFGRLNELAMFEMENEGLKEISNINGYYIEHLDDDIEGQSFTGVYEGSNLIFTAIQSLIVHSKQNGAKRISDGVDSNRLNLLIALVDKFTGSGLENYDIYMSLVGKLSRAEKENDLSIIASLLSQLGIIKIKSKSIFLGEIDLSGKVLPIRNMNNKLREIQRYGFKNVYISSNLDTEDIPKNSNFKIIKIKNISSLINLNRAS